MVTAKLVASGPAMAVKVLSKQDSRCRWLALLCLCERLISLLSCQLSSQMGQEQRNLSKKTNIGSPPIFLGDCRLQKHGEDLIAFALKLWLPKRPGVILTLGNMWLPSACGAGVMHMCSFLPGQVTRTGWERYRSGEIN